MSDERASVTFRRWKELLAAEPWAADIKAQTARGIIGFLRHCKGLHSPVSVAMANGTIAEVEGQARTGAAPQRGARSKRRLRFDREAVKSMQWAARPEAVPVAQLDRAAVS